MRLQPPRLLLFVWEFHRLPMALHSHEYREVGDLKNLVAFGAVDNLTSLRSCVRNRKLKVADFR